VSVDVRTRSDGRRVAVEAAAFLDNDLPVAFDNAAPRLERSIRERPPRPLTIEVDGQRWTLEVTDHSPVVRRGDVGGAPVLRLDGDQLANLVTDQDTPVGWLAAGTLHLEGGQLALVLDWWLLLRGALDGVTPYSRGAVSIEDRDGDDLDLGRSFTSNDPVDEMGWFLGQAGFVHLKGVFSEAEMAAVSADMDTAAPRYEEGDGRSWWASLDDGTRALVRMQRFGEESDTADALVTDDRVARLADLTGDGHEWGGWEDNRIEALFKPVGVVHGISDIPWHKDCSLGRHSYDCCAMTVGISVTGADATSGQLRVVAGSHRALVWPAPTLQPGLDLPVVDLATETGDVTVHLSCTLHMAQPPVEQERRVMYTSFRLPAIDPRAHANRERLRATREAAPLNTTQPAAR
jgi:hypothetical protein